MRKKHITSGAAKNSKINKKKVIISSVAVVLSLCVLIFGMINAKYLNERSSDGVVRAKNFYFKSVFLDGKEHTISPDSTSITFTLGNHEDDLRYSEVDINYTVSVNNGAKVTSGGSGTLTNGVIDDAEVTVSNLQVGNTYEITAVGKGGYTKTLKATVIVPAKETKIYHYLDDSASEYTLLTVWNEGDEAGNVTITYTGIPDNTNPKMTDWLKNESREVAIGPHESVVFRFFSGTVNIQGSELKELS